MTTGLPFLPLITTVAWTTVGVVGVTGLCLSPAEPVTLPAKSVVEAPATKFEVKLVAEADDAPEPDNKPPSDQKLIDQVLTDAPPAAPAVAAMAEGSQVAFAIPVACPAVLVGKSAASGQVFQSVAGGVPGGVAGGLPVTKITFGKGFAGGLPAPRYPEEARLNGWQGSVTVRFAIDSSGRVMVAKVIDSSGRPLLDQEARDTVLRRWKFPAGSPPGPFDWTAHFVLE